MVNKDITRLDLIKGATIFKQGHHDMLSFIPRNAQGEIVDLTGKDINVVIVHGKTIVYDGAAIFNTEDNTIQFTIDKNIGYGDMWMEFTVTDANDPTYRQKFPTSEYDGKLKFIRSSDDLDYVGFSGKTVAQFEADQEEFKTAVQGEIITIEQTVQEGIAAFTEDTEVINARGGEVNLGTRFDKTIALLAEKAGKAEVRMKNVLIDTVDITPGLQSQIAGTAPVANSIPANQSVTVNTVATETFDEIRKKADFAKIIEQKHGQLINKFSGNAKGSRTLTTDTVDGCTISFVDSSEDIPYPITKVTKINRLSYSNKTTYFWYKKQPIANVALPEISGYWLRKSDLLNMSNFNRLIWFHDAAGTSIKLISTTFISANIVAGFKHTQTFSDVGVTATFECKAERNGWLYIVQSIDKKPVNAATVGMGIYAVNGTAVTGKLDFVGITQLEGETEILPYALYAESVAERALTDAEIGKALSASTTSSKPTVNFGYNLEATIRKYRASLAKRDSRVVKIAAVGDSITEGFWSGLNHERAYPVKLRKLMQAKYGGQDEGFVTVADTVRWTTTGTWTTAKKGMALSQKSSAVSGDYIELTFNGVAIDVLYSKNTDGGNSAVEIDGVVKTSLQSYGATEVYAQSQSYAGLSAGNHVLRIYAPVDGKKVYIEGAYVKTVGDTGGIRVDRRALAGSAAVEWSYPQLVRDTFATQPADLFLLALGINDCGAGRTTAQLKGYLQTLITSMLPVGSVILIPMMQASSTDTRFANWSEYVKVYYELAEENNIGLIDIHKLFGDYATAQSLGLFGIENGNGEGSDTIHPSARGHQMIADTIFKIIG